RSTGTEGPFPFVAIERAVSILVPQPNEPFHQGRLFGGQLVGRQPTVAIPIESIEKFVIGHRHIRRFGWLAMAILLPLGPGGEGERESHCRRTPQDAHKPHALFSWPVGAGSPDRHGCEVPFRGARPQQVVLVVKPRRPRGGYATPG